MLCHYCLDIKKRFQINSGNVQKLIPTLNDKENYVLHEENLKLYLKLGLKFKKVHRVLQFREKSWLKKYIDFNTGKRKEEDLYRDRDLFDNSDYKEDSKFCFDENKKVIGKFKDEAAG